MRTGGTNPNFENIECTNHIHTLGLPFSKVDVSYDNPLVASTQDYIANGAVSSTYAFSRLLPSDFWSENGAVMQQYLVGQMDRDTAADAVQAYWQAQ